jgi:hypothetical protein
VSRQQYDDGEPEDASRFLIGLVTCFAMHDNPLTYAPLRDLRVVGRLGQDG